MPDLQSVKKTLANKLASIVWNTFAIVGILSTLLTMALLWLLFFPINKVPDEKTALNVAQKKLIKKCNQLKIPYKEYKLDYLAYYRDYPNIFGTREEKYVIYFKHKSGQPCMNITMNIETDESIQIESPSTLQLGQNRLNNNEYCYKLFKNKGLKVNASGWLFDPNLQ